jgi:hypothetical protein
LDALEYGVSNFPNPFNAFPQVSGLRFDINPTINNAIKIESDKLNVDGERRVSNVKVNGKDLNLTKLYNVSLLEFTGNAGYGYFMFAKYKIFTQSLNTDTDSLMHYIKYNLKGEIPEKYKDIQNRIIVNDSSYSQVIDNNLSPKVILLSFHSYKFSENPYKIEFEVIVRIVNYPNEVYSLIMGLDIEYIRLRFLEEEVVTCTIKSHQVSSEMYDFFCSLEVSGPCSSISVISSNIIINGKSPANSSTSEVAKNYGENIQNQTNKFFSGRRGINETFDNCSVYTEDNKLIFKGENKRYEITSRDSLLAFGQGEHIKNIMCDISDVGNNKFKMVCEPTFTINADFSENNEVYINNFEKTVMMKFKKGESFATLDIENNSNLQLYKKTSSEGTFNSPILIIILLLIALLAIIIFTVCLCKNSCKATDQENDKSTSTSENSTNITNSERLKGQTVSKDNTMGVGQNTTMDNKGN